ncbi:MAG: 2-hydroxychromene-2-carboxylate isomerase [Acetobacter sp.]|jgi:2-hydroxychromene-2-carboxylate isomerase|nr:2-hydroxychromene-2-carboxylate isomerase [Acetobacter sp.]MCH4061265.1 2-hydroxychromene-2-carboxylate isomerase [Acetobacter sp.]MCH4088202.1 2-hydroxychromene-2-carboxylate isomerase [Acetobacter sp.]MCI1294602.1 2-hydroxychromene-2-carboxylate isomerase [Acetobacter sp.]MCI1374589.1 2-hydroxychromene-2-carboxylate isomerase [Acetobacter sp.]
MNRTATQPVVEAFYGISSPWAYLGFPRLRQIVAQEGAGLILRPIRIIQANGGIPLRTRPVARQEYHRVELRRWRDFLNLPLNLDPKFYPCRTIEPAARLVIAAGQKGLDEAALSWEIQSALWAQDKDIADPETLCALVEKTTGADGKSLLEASDTPEVMAAWQNNLEDAERLGIFGTPTYVLDNELFWGQDRLDFLQRKLQSMKLRRHADMEKENIV